MNRAHAGTARRQLDRLPGFLRPPPDLATSSGQVTNAAYGFTRMLIKLLGDHQPDAVVVAWDVSRQTFRSTEYPAYKAQRDAAPDAFKSQMPLIGAVLDSLEVPQLRLEGYEADDLIASIGDLAAKVGWDVLLVTGDRDAFQLIDDHLKVLYTRRGITDVVVADEDYVRERYGIRPDQYVDYAALRGDTSDNLPGVPGVGEKTATKLIADYGKLEGLYTELDQQTPRLRQNLAEHREQVFLNRKLMTLVRDLDLDLDLDAPPAGVVGSRRGQAALRESRVLFSFGKTCSRWSRRPDRELPGRCLSPRLAS